MGTNPEIVQQSNIVFFDGVCNLCNSSVNFLIDRDPQGRLSFCSLQSQFAIDALQGTDFNAKDLDSIIYLENGNFYHKSDAALRIARHLKGFWPILSLFLFLPKFIRDGAYDIIAKNRYRWFGKEESCRMPQPHLAQRFIFD